MNVYMQQSNRRSVKGPMMLLLCAMIWGSAFAVMKSALDTLPPLPLLTVRFLGASAVLALVFHRHLKNLTWAVMRKGALAGVLEAAAYVVQTWGLQDTTPGVNAFLTATYCVLVPFAAWAWFHDRPTGRQVFAGFLCLVGIGLLSLSDSLSMGRGEALSLLCGVLFALQVTAISRFGREGDVLMLTLAQLITAALFCGTLTLVMGERLPAGLGASEALHLIYLAVICTALPLTLQNVGQSLTPAAPAAVILSLESVFGVLTSVLVGMESPTPRQLVAFVLVFAAVLLGQMAGEKKADPKSLREVS